MEKTVTKVMKEQGEIAADCKTSFNTAVKIKWAMKRKFEKFNIKAAFINLLNKIDTVDRILYLQSNVTNKVWKTAEEIPTGDEFTRAFDIKQEVFRKGLNKVRAYASIVSTVHTTMIKFKDQVYAHLKKHNIYVHQDMLARSNIVSPGTIVGIHPTLVRKEDYTEEIKYSLEKMKLPDTEVCKTWVCNNKPNYSHYAGPTPIPRFCLVIEKEKWGGGPNR
eukprot:3056155-Ditylum_brightwellii.AAC.1